MTLEELLLDEETRRHEFPVCARKTFLAHAGVSPLPRRVAEAMQRYLDAASRDDQEDVVPDDLVRGTRQLTANLIDANEDEIAFVGSTSMGLAMVAAGLPWRRGDNVVCYKDDYPANVYPWMNLASQGMEVRFVEPRQYGNVTVGDVERMVDGSTRLVALSSVHFVSGWRLDLDNIGRVLRERGVLFCVDCIQSLGALRTGMRFVDFAAADAHKWLLGPLGTAVLYVRKECFEQMRPPLVGWRSASCPDYIAQDKLVLWPSARRYEPGSLNLVGVVGLRAALELISGFGLERIEQRVLTLAKLVANTALRKGWTVIGPSDADEMSGIVSLTAQGRDLVGLHKQLAAANFITSVRRRRDGVICLRVSAHFYNTEEEVSRLMDML